MDEENTRDFRQACEQCHVINWAITDEGKFFCKSCHNVIEKTADGTSEIFVQNARVHAISRGLKKRNKLDRGCEWYICEGFQYILNRQAKALIALGTSPLIKWNFFWDPRVISLLNRPTRHFKLEQLWRDEILCNVWRRYLQKSQQAYTSKPIAIISRKRKNLEVNLSSSGFDTETDTSSLHRFSGSENDSESAGQDNSINSFKNAEDETTPVLSGSVDGSLYAVRAAHSKRLLMSMPMTLAFCYLALLWLRESITLSDLLQFVSELQLPYINAFQYFPEEMKLYGPDIRVFQVQSIPSYNEIQRKMRQLAEFLDLPHFPEITEKCFLHPNLLCIKYLLEANLPESMHIWTQRLVKKMGIGEVDYLTFNPSSRRAKSINYEIQAAAVIVITLKLLFVLDDKHEWLQSNRAEELNKQNHGGIKHFRFSKWYKVMKSCLDESEKKAEEQKARYLWKCEKPLFSIKNKAVVHKRKRIIHSLTKQFVKLTSQPALEKREPSSFWFLWKGSCLERQSFHEDSLNGYDNEKSEKIINVNQRYWLTCLKICNEKFCRHLTKAEMKHFPGSYRFVLNLFSFLLGVEFSSLYDEVCLLEHKLFDIPEALKPGKINRKLK